MAGRRRGRTGRGWDAAPPRTPRRATEKPAKRAQDPTPDAAERAREICLRQLAVRPRTRAELATALRRHGVDDRVAREVLDRYHEVGMIDDAAFAAAWVSSRHQGKGLARRALGSELRRRGVASETVGEALDQLDADTEAATARALVDRKLRTTTGSPEAIVRRLVGMLARKGYPAGLAYRVVKEALADDERTTELADRLDPDALADAADPEPDG
jgi:regulatory protein